MKEKRNRKSKKTNQMKEIWRRFRKSKTDMLGLCLLIFVLSIAIFADVITPYENAISQSADRLDSPSAAHIFGTDELGRDLFARIVHGSRYSLLIGVSTSVLALVIGGLLGAIAAYYGGWVDNIIMRLTDVVMTVPPILLSLAVVAALGGSLRNLLIAITISCVPSMLRLVRSVVLGVQPPAPEWGALLSDAKTYMFTAPHLLYIPGIFIVIAALSFNLAGDGLRDALDPKLKD